MNKNKYWASFLKGYLSIFEFNFFKKHNIKHQKLEVNLVDSSSYINKAFKRIRNDEN